jgi:MFS family permease
MSAAYEGGVGDLLILAAIAAASGFARTAISPLQETMRLALELNDNQMSILQGPAIGIPAVLTAIPLGVLIDRSSRVRLLVWLLGFGLAGSLYTALADGFLALLVARSIAGLAALSMIPVCYALLADFFVSTQRGRATTALIVAQVMGNSAAFALGGTLLTAMDSTQSWRWTMLWLVVPLVLMSLPVFALREPVRKPSNTVPAAAVSAAVARRYDLLPLFAIGSGIVMVEVAVGAILIWGAPMLQREFALLPDRVGLIMAIAGFVSGVGGAVVGGLLADFCQRTAGVERTITVLCALAFIGAPCCLFAFTSSAAAVSILSALAMAVMLAIAVMGIALFTIVAPAEYRGLAMSVLMAAILFFALAVAPPSVSLLSGALGGERFVGEALSLVCLVATLASGSVFLFGRWAIRRQAGTGAAARGL